MKSDDRQANNTAHSSRQSGGPAGPVLADAEYASHMLDAAEALPAGCSPDGEVAMSKESADAPTLVILPAQCMMRDALDLKAQLLKCLETTDAVQIDAAKLERIDAAGVQVLLAFVLDRAKQDRNVEWCAVNKTMRDAAKAMGLESTLRLPAEAA
ncbi:MAG: STAS domain-containing protein [Steroidobacter sp.]